MIDKFNIFQEIKDICNMVCPNCNVYAFGSRIRGTSTANKWDFDVLVDCQDMQIIKTIILDIKTHFIGRKDEFGKNVVVDIFATKRTFEELKNLDIHAILL